MGAREALSSSNLSVLDTDCSHPEHQSGRDGQIAVISLIRNGMGLAQILDEELLPRA